MNILLEVFLACVFEMMFEIVTCDVDSDMWTPDFYIFVQSSSKVLWYYHG